MASPRRTSESSACTFVGRRRSSSSPLTVTFAPIETASPPRAAAAAAVAAAATAAAAASTPRLASDWTPPLPSTPSSPSSPSTPPHLVREQILPRPLFLPPRDQAPLASVLSRTLSSASGDDHAGSHRRSDAAAATRRNRRRRNSNRSGGSAQRLATHITAQGCSTITSTVPVVSRRSAASSLECRRRYHQRESEITEERLSRRFPTKTVVTLSTLHLVVCVVVLLIQFWTSSQVAAHNKGADFTALNWAKSVNTYGYLSALLAGLAGCAGIALYLWQSKVRAIWFLSMSVSAVLIACYLLTFYTSYFAEIRFFVSAQGCMEKYDKDPNFELPFALMMVLMLLEFFFGSISIVVVGTVINRARACWWSCDPCAICQLDEDLEIPLEDVEEGAVDDYVGVASSPRLAFEMPPSYLDRPPPYKP